MPTDDFKNFFILKTLEEKKNRNFFDFFFKNKWTILVLVLIFISILIIHNIFFTKINFNDKEAEKLFQINNGESIAYIGQRLQNEKIIQSALAFKVYIKLFSNSEIAQAGIYEIEKKDTLVSLANKIIKGEYAVPPVRVTIPEGSDAVKTATIISEAFLAVANKTNLADDFSVENILSKTKDKTGYLFPETYLFLPNVTLDNVVSQMSDNFYTRLYDFLDSKKQNLHIYALDLTELDLSNYFNSETKVININKRLSIINEVGTTTLSLKDIITMASYLEGEANNEQDMRMVAGVLWTRLKIGYPLQIDAATSTYKHKGFTDTPINNPGMVAIESAINPINLGYIYYITGNDGKNYYAKTYEEHLNNINKYLRNNR